MQRVSASAPCRVCGGHDRMPRGHGLRCTGFVGSDGKYLHCSRPERAGDIAPSENQGGDPTYAHIATGKCRCGSTHGLDLSALGGRRLPPRDSARTDTALPASAPAVTTNQQPIGRKIVATYDYVEEGGELLYQVVRFEPKGFSQRRPCPRCAGVVGGLCPPDCKNGWIWNLKGIEPTLYHLPEVIAAVAAGDTVYVCEGEKDVEAMRAAGMVATCNSGGAGKWPPQQYLRWAEVVIVQDMDEPGAKHAMQVYDDLHEFSTVRIVQPRSGKDAADHLAAGYGVEDFVPVELSENSAQISDDSAPSPILTAAEITADVIPPYVIKGIAHEGHVTLITGTSKVGKSYWSSQAGMCVATGQPFLGLDVKQSNVLYVCLEMISAVLRDRIADIAADTGIRQPCFDTEFRLMASTAERWLRVNILDPADRESLKSAIQASGAKLVVLDTLHRFVIGGGEVNANETQTAIFDLIHQLAHETKAAFLVLDHTAKNGPQDAGAASTSAIGAQSKGATASTIVKLTRKNQSDPEAEERFELRVDSHFGSWQKPLYYRRPTRPDGSAGSGCVVMSDVEAVGLTLESIVDVFESGALDASGNRYFKSVRDLRDAIKAELNIGSDAAHRMVELIERHFVSAGEFDGRPIQILPGSGRSGTRYTLIRSRTLP